MRILFPGYRDPRLLQGLCALSRHEELTPNERFEASAYLANYPIDRSELVDLLRSGLDILLPGGVYDEPVQLQMETVGQAFAVDCAYRFALQYREFELRFETMLSTWEELAGIERSTADRTDSDRIRALPHLYRREFLTSFMILRNTPDQVTRFACRIAPIVEEIADDSNTFLLSVLLMIANPQEDLGEMRGFIRNVLTQPGSLNRSTAVVLLTFVGSKHLREILNQDEDPDVPDEVLCGALFNATLDCFPVYVTDFFECMLKAGDRFVHVAATLCRSVFETECEDPMGRLATLLEYLEKLDSTRMADELYEGLVELLGNSLPRLVILTLRVLMLCSQIDSKGTAALELLRRSEKSWIRNSATNVWLEFQVWEQMASRS